MYAKDRHTIPQHIDLRQTSRDLLRAPLSHVWHARALITVTFQPSDRLSPLLVPLSLTLCPPPLHRGGETNRRAPLAPQRGAARMRAPIRRISIRVVTLSEAGQFSPVREIGPLYPIAIYTWYAISRCVSRLSLVHSSSVNTRLVAANGKRIYVRDANRGLKNPITRRSGSRDTCTFTRRGGVCRLCQ